MINSYTLDESESIPLPDAFVTTILPQIDSLEELQLSLYCFWAFAHQVSDPRYLAEKNLLEDDQVLKLVGGEGGESKQKLLDSLKKACEHGTLLEGECGAGRFYFPNTERGKAARDGLAAGKWQPEEDGQITVRFTPERPNIYALYEQNIGVLTPLIAETLQEAEQEYPAEWIEEAIRIAVTRNARNWRFVEAVLKNWKEKGRNETDRRSAQEDRKRDSEGKFSDYVNH